MATYTVQPGDTLPSIARALLGDPGRWRELQLYNRLMLIDPANLAPGMELVLPPGAAIPATPRTRTGETAASAPAGLSRTRPLRAVARRRPHPQWSRR